MCSHPHRKKQRRITLWGGVGGGITSRKKMRADEQGNGLNKSEGGSKQRKTRGTAFAQRSLKRRREEQRRKGVERVQRGEMAIIEEAGVMKGLLVQCTFLDFNSSGLKREALSLSFE